MVPPRLPAGVQPIGRISFPHRANRAACVIDVGARQQRPDRGLEPSGRHTYIIIGIEDDLAARERLPGVEGDRFALTPLERVAERHRKRWLAVLDAASGRVARVVVDNQHLPGDVGGGTQSSDAVERRPEECGTVIRANQNGDGHGRSGHALTAEWAADTAPSISP